LQLLLQTLLFPRFGIQLADFAQLELAELLLLDQRLALAADLFQ